MPPAPRRHRSSTLLRCALCALCGFLFCTTEAQADQGKPEIRWFALPNIGFDTDDGLGFGARGELAVHQPGYAPYKTAYVVHIFATLRGFHHHRFRYDRTGLGPGRRLRLTAHLAWRQWLNDGYWGIGNRTTRQRAYVEQDLDAEDPRRKRYRYTLFQPFLHVTLRARLARRWRMFASVNAKYSMIETYPGSLLAEQRPFGMDGGLTLLLSGGFLYDSREPEVDPRRGLFAELSGRAAGPLPHGAGAFGGLFASVRGYVSPAPWLVLAARLMGEMLWGEVPFYEMVHWGGAVPVAGFGGFETLRGVSFGRWRAPGKAIFNGEARFYVLRHTLFSRPMVWQLALLLDAGVVWGAGEADSTPDAEADSLPIHPAAGVGLRVIFEETFVGRVDFGLAPDPVREPDGEVAQQLSWGIYFVFDHAF